MRHDAIGMFWEDLPPVKAPKVEKPKRIPPEPTWLSPDYLPGLEEARAMAPDLFSDMELYAASLAGDRLAFDIECYPNYFLIAFKSITSGKVIYFEQRAGQDLAEWYHQLSKLEWVLKSFTLVDFFGTGYDVPLCSVVLDGADTYRLYEATKMLILGEEGKRVRSSDVLKKFKVQKLELNHIDLIELTPLRPGLKVVSGRLHAPRMQDLPFIPGTVLTDDQITITRWYCVNDLDNTIILYKDCRSIIELREKMSVRYGVDLRSHSDPQIAEAVISTEIRRITGQNYLPRPQIEPGTIYRYNIPHFVRYQSPLMNHVLDIVRASEFIVAPNGSVLMPKGLEDMEIRIGDGVYRMGIGGLHSSEKSTAHIADENTILCDRDVTSYYPWIILNLGLAPKHLGQNFLRVYNNIVVTRVKAKETGDKTTDASLKVVINGSFGKLGSKYSILYSPDLLITVTVTGQLSLLMLIERLELAGIPVVSANTDGIVIKCPSHKEEEMEGLVAQWEKDTGFQTEATYYAALFSRDVNNYFAVKKDGTYKAKGAYAEKASTGNTERGKNPLNQICNDAVAQFLTKGTPIAETIRGCQDIRKFITMRAVTGGAWKDGVFLGKAIRWYYAKGVEGEIIYAKTGNKVPRSEGAKPIMTLPEEFPQDVDYEWYETEAYKILGQIGFLQGGGVEEEEEVEEGEEVS